MIQHERRNQCNDRVWISTGNTSLRKHVAEIRKSKIESVNGLLDRHACAQSRALADYLNNLPPNRFSTMMRKHLPEALAAADGDEQQLNILKAVQDEAKPLYVSGERSVRLFSFQSSILSLRRDLRKIMTQDWITMDLRSAQLAIVATIWDVPSIKEYLATGRCIWRDLCEHMGLEFSSDSKAVLKNALYAIIFGAGCKSMEQMMGLHFSSGKAAYQHLKRNSIIHALLRARSTQLKRIRDAKRGIDAFGREMPLEYTIREGERFRFDNSRSILACIAQSYELLLLMPIVEIALAQQFMPHGFSLTTWLHDGFTLDVHQQADRNSWCQRLTEMVREQAESLGIMTGLEVS